MSNPRRVTANFKFNGKWLGKSLKKYLQSVTYTDVIFPSTRSPFFGYFFLNQSISMFWSTISSWSLWPDATSV